MKIVVRQHDLLMRPAAHGLHHKRAAAAGLLLLMAWASTVRSGAGDEGYRAAHEQTDLRLAALARQALQGHPRLAPWNLGVRVQDRIATLWGPVPSLAIGRIAEDQLRAMPELRGVRNELQVPAMEEPMPPASQRKAPSPAPAKIPALRHQPAVAPERNERRRSILTNNAAPPSLDSPVALLPPIAVPMPQASTPAPTAHETRGPTDLEKALAALRRQFRTQGLTLEIRDAVVYISGPTSRSDDLFALAQVIAELPGVKRVLVRNQPATKGR
jgi:hypothetical protein